jgi:hypothetical protein
MPDIRDVLELWPSDGFADGLARHLESLGSDALGLARAGSLGGLVDPASVRAVVMNVNDGGEAIRAEVGIFFEELLIGCNCSDDPTPVSQTGYCRLRIEIDRLKAEATITHLSE